MRPGGAMSAGSAWRVIADVAALPRKGRIGVAEELRITISELEGSNPPRRTLNLRHWRSGHHPNRASQSARLRPHLMEAARLLSDGSTPPTRAPTRAEAEAARKGGQ
jgi:hypothetical protein